MAIGISFLLLIEFVVLVFPCSFAFSKYPKWERLTISQTNIAACRSLTSIISWTSERYMGDPPTDKNLLLLHISACSCPQFNDGQLRSDVVFTIFYWTNRMRSLAHEQTVSDIEIGVLQSWNKVYLGVTLYQQDL